MGHFSLKDVAGLWLVIAFSLLVVAAGSNAYAEEPPLARWEASLNQSYRHYEARTFVTPTEALDVEMRLGDCWMARKFLESPKRETWVTTQVRQIFGVGLKTKERSFPNIGIGIYELRRPEDLDVLDTGCWPSNQAMVQVRGGNLLARMSHTCRNTLYFRYDTADFLRALEAIGFPMDHIFVTPCGGLSARVSKEQVYKRDKAKRKPWKMQEAVRRNAIKEALRHEIPTRSETESQ